MVHARVPFRCRDVYGTCILLNDLYLLDLLPSIIIFASGPNKGRRCPESSGPMGGGIMLPLFPFVVYGSSDAG